jgi:hypothetical protein
MQHTDETYGARCGRVRITGHGARKNWASTQLPTVTRKWTSKWRMDAARAPLTKSKRSGHVLTAHARPHMVHAPQPSEWLHALPYADP